MGKIPDLWAKTEAPSREAAIKEASAWVATDPKTNVWAPIAGTGSMKDGGIDENCIVLMQTCDGSGIKKGDLVSYRFSDKYPNVLHRVDAINENAFIPNGMSNKHYDGWQNRNAIHHKAVKIIRFPATVDPSKVLATPTEK